MIDQRVKQKINIKQRKEQTTSTFLGTMSIHLCMEICMESKQNNKIRKSFFFCWRIVCFSSVLLVLAVSHIIYNNHICTYAFKGINAELQIRDTLCINIQRDELRGDHTISRNFIKLV